MAPSKLLQTALAQIDAYNAVDIEAILALRTVDCLHEILPLSLRRPALTNEQYRVYFKENFPQFPGFKLHILETTVDQDAHRVVFHAKSNAETAIGPYSNEYFLSLSMTEDDILIKEFREFVDSAYSNKFFGRMQNLVKL